MLLAMNWARNTVRALRVKCARYRAEIGFVPLIWDSGNVSKNLRQHIIRYEVYKRIEAVTTDFDL